jgi:hypothetical protein
VRIYESIRPASRRPHFRGGSPPVHYRPTS